MAASKAVRVDLTFSSSTHARRFTACCAFAVTDAADADTRPDLVIWVAAARTRDVYFASNSASSLQAALYAPVAASSA